MIHFTALFRYVEEAEHAFYRSLGGAAFERTDEGYVGMPRVSANLDFLAPVRYADEVEVRLVLREKRSRVLRYSAEIALAEGAVVARGGMTVVCAKRSHGTLDYAATDLPMDLFDQLESVPDD